MKLVHIKEEKCPTCDARVVYERQRTRHTNGEWFETREFECGLQIEHIPNFSRNQKTEQCKNDPDYKSMLEKLRKFNMSLLNFIRSADIPATFKMSAIRRLGFLTDSFLSERNWSLQRELEKEIREEELLLYASK